MRLITTALRQELCDFKKHIKIEGHLVLPPCQFYHGRYREEEVGLLLTSVGPAPQALRQVIDTLAKNFSIQRAVITGFSGGLVPGLKSGDLVRLEQLICDKEQVAEAEKGYAEGKTQADIKEQERSLYEFQKRYFCCDLRADREKTSSHKAKIDFFGTNKTKRATVRGVFPSAYLGIGITVSTPCTTRAEKETLAARTGAIAVDMENFHIATCLKERDIPFIVVRSIFDPLELELPPPSVSNLVDARGCFRPSKGVELVLRHPRDILKIPDFARRASQARRSLTQFLLHFLD